MDNLFLALQAIFPAFALLIIGYILKSVAVINDNTVRQMNKLLFWVCLPCLLFNSVYQNGLQANFESKLLIFALVAAGGMFLISAFLATVLERENKKSAAMLQALGNNDFSSFGIPLVVAISGIALGGSYALLTAVMVPVFNLLAVISLEIFRGNRPNFFKVLKGILTNPLILASLAAGVLVYFHVPIPNYIGSVLHSVGSISMPLAFILVGVYFNFSNITDYPKQIVITTFLKTLLFPAIILTIAVLMQFRGADLAMILALFSAPTAVSSFPMAQEEGADERLAGQLIVFTLIFSVGAVFLFTFILKQMAFL